MILSMLVLLGAGPNPYLAQARKHHDALEFKKCLQALELAPRFESTVRERAEVELYDGLCRFNLGEVQKAREHFELALGLDPGVELPPLISPKIEAVFSEVRKAMPAADAPKVEPVPERAALTPTVHVEAGGLDPIATPIVSRSYVLPAVLGGAAVAAGVVAVGLGVHALDEAGRSNGASFQSDRIAYGQNATGAALGSNVAWGLAGALVISAAVALVLEVAK